MANTGREEIRKRILQQIVQASEHHSDKDFNEVALSVFTYQFEHSTPYQRLCWEAKHDPSKINTWRDIPPVPVMAFKYLDVTCRPPAEACRIFRSSGTTQGTEHRSSHYIFDLELAEAAIASSFERHVLPQGSPMPMAILTPPPEELPDSSLCFMMETVQKHFASPSSAFYIQRGKLQTEKLLAVLESAQEPILLLGTSFSFVHFLDFLKKKGVALKLPQGSRLMDTGGFKGKSRELQKEALHTMYTKLLGISKLFCINEYGMAEMSSQCYDGVAGVEGSPVFVTPSHVRKQVLDPTSLIQAEPGKSGLLCLYDLANLDSAVALLTQDIGREVPGGFEVVGRANDAELKGCSLLIDGLLQES